MLSSSLEVFQAAMPMIGARVPTSMDDQSAAAKAARAYYEILVGECLSRHSWSWATRSQALVYAGETGETPLYKYTMPAEVVTPRRIEIGGVRFTDWELKAEKGERPTVRTSLYDSKSLILIFNYRAPEAVWPPGFVSAVTHMLAGYLATGLLDRANQGEMLTNMGERMLRREMRKDRNSFPGRNTDPDPILVRAWNGHSAWADTTRSGLGALS